MVKTLSFSTAWGTSLILSWGTKIPACHVIEKKTTKNKKQVAQLNVRQFQLKKKELFIVSLKFRFR